MSLEALENERLVIGRLFLGYLQKVFIDLVVVDGSQSSYFSSFSFSLNLAQMILLHRCSKF